MTARYADAPVPVSGLRDRIEDRFDGFVAALARLVAVPGVARPGYDPAELERRFPQVQILVSGAEDPDPRAHGTDESLDVEDLRRGMLAEALLLARLNRRAGPH
jgi:acetylornithine deacetylase/succinyl-diaminopimelate desuccinylase-like protein